jgi:hypothetical protein
MDRNVVKKDKAIVYENLYTVGDPGDCGRHTALDQAIPEFVELRL